MKGEFGVMKRVHCKLAKNQQVSETRSVGLETFAGSLDKGQVRAVHASRAEWGIEGPYWLAQMQGKAYQTTEDQVIFSLTFRYVDIQWAEMTSCEHLTF